ncbi:LOW QUALITY PROTEIN: spermatogenesis-associated serine-rich protein 2 [Zonotrichia albicollis]|uniref:LOW QUALITY PROTEIN: spermatogenesis-associated serine-rich protein 2 n=1 Tax=Zonotrichia albicollis TaxID=44394 RepID=UPI003D810BB2
MSKKQQPKDPSGFVFDSRSGAVRAQGGAENMREKVQAVRAVVPNRSNTEIVLVLQHFDNAVDRAVQAFMEGNASEVLKEWTVTGKKKNKKKKPKPKAQPGPRSPRAGEKGNFGIIPIFFPIFPCRPSLERSLKDLQRCSVALARFRALLRDEVENSLRRVKGVFGEIQSCLMDREVALLAEMDKVKAEAMDLLSVRQLRAESLRALTEAAPAMSEEELQELRADIKHFVSERKFDEELGRAGRFGCDLEALRGSIGAFGQVSHPRPSYSSRSRCSSSPAPTAAPATAGTTVGSTTGSTLGSATTTGSTLGSAPGFPTGSAPGSAPGSPQGGAAPTEPPRSPQSRNPPGAAGARPEPPRNPKNPKNPKNPENPKNPKSPENPKPPGDPKSPKNPENPKNPKSPKNPENPKSPKNPKNPENAKNPKSPKNPENPKSPKGARSRPGPRRSRPEGANS